eukprot:67945-Alexandrium_andersonii.AAC.1
MLPCMPSATCVYARAPACGRQGPDPSLGSKRSAQRAGLHELSSQHAIGRIRGRMRPLRRRRSLRPQAWDGAGA